MGCVSLLLCLAITFAAVECRRTNARRMGGTLKNSQEAQSKVSESNENDTSVDNSDKGAVEPTNLHTPTLASVAGPAFNGTSATPGSHGAKPDTKDVSIERRQSHSHEVGLRSSWSAIETSMFEVTSQMQSLERLMASAKIGKTTIFAGLGCVVLASLLMFCLYLRSSSSTSDAEALADDTQEKQAEASTEPSRPTRRASLSDARRLSVAAPEGTAKEKDILVNLVTGGLGTGILCLPWLTAGASLVPSLLIIIAVLVVNAWTISILLEAAEQHQVFDFGNLLAKLPGTLGKVMQPLSNAIVWLSTFLCLIGYIIVMADSILEALSWQDQMRWILVCAATCAVCPLCFLDQSKLAFTSVLTLLAFVYIFGLIGTELATTGLHTQSCYLGVGKGIIAMIGGMANCVIVQMCVLPMYGELADRSPEKMNRVVRWGFLGLFLLFASFSVGGYLLFGPNVEDNILMNIGGATVQAKIAQVGAAVAVMGVYPILVNPMLAPIRSSPNLEKFTMPVTILIVAASGLCAIFLTSLGSLSVVNGAICAGIFVAMLPAAVGSYLLNKPAWQMGVLVLAGIAAAALGIVYMDNMEEALSCISPQRSVT